MRLELDAKNFEVPDFDISVQPGLVTDPSVGALIDSAFNPSDSSQYALQQRTIALITDVNAVLARAGKSMDTVRTTLSDSSETLGTQTVSDLKGSTKSIAESVKALQTSTSSLGKDLNGSLTETKTTTNKELAQLVDSINGLLGDTSGRSQPARVSGSGCDLTVQKPDAANSVYGNLLEVSGLLKGYAGATEQCKRDLTDKITNVIGPKYPNAITCLGTDPDFDLPPGEFAGTATCSLFVADAKVARVAGRLTKYATTASGLLTGLKVDKLDDAVNGIKNPAHDTDPTQPEYLQGGLLPAAQDLSEAALVNSGLNTSAVTQQLDLADGYYDDVVNIANDLRGQAVEHWKEAGTLGGTNADLAKKICVFASKLTPDEVESLRKLTSKTSCADPDGPSVNDGSMQQQIEDQQSAWDYLAVKLDTTSTAEGSLGRTLQNLQTALANVRTEVEKLGDSADFTDLAQANTTLQKYVGDVDYYTKEVKKDRNTVAGEIQGTFEEAGKDVEENGDLDPQIRTIYDNSIDSSTGLDELFARSNSGLTSASKQILTDGKKTIGTQKKAFKGRQLQSSQRINSTIAKGLKQVDTGVSSSTKDMEAAKSMLTADLLDVLKDLGVRKVKGSGLLGAMATSVASTKSANGQLGKATDTTSSYSNVRQRDMAGILLQQAQADASRKMQAAMPAFRLALPASAEHRTVYSFHLASGS